MSTEESPDLQESARKLRTAYRMANRLIVGAGITLAAAGVAKDAPELKALRLALRAVNVAGGIQEAPPLREQEEKPHVKEKPHGYRGVSGPRFGGPGRVA